MPSDDRFILIMAVVTISAWLLFAFLRWVYKPNKANLSFLAHGERQVGPAVDLLEQEGYEVLHGKHKIPIKMMIDSDENAPKYSHYFIDYFARKNGEIYAVRVAKDRQPIRWSGSGIRDHLLPLYLIYEEEISGVLYVDMMHRQVKQIAFILDEDEEYRRTP